jgi:hypothetical protein
MAWHGARGQRLYYEDSGRGDAVVLLHGWAGSIVDLEWLASTADGWLGDH